MGVYEASDGSDHFLTAFLCAWGNDAADTGECYGRSMSDFECPKCDTDMQTFSRSGLQVEQCPRCRGVFLDYGELEHLLAAESAYYSGQGGAAPMPPVAPHVPPPMPQTPPQQHFGHHTDERYHGGHGGHHGHKKRKSFLEELFD